jgi:VanZ family protein
MSRKTAALAALSAAYTAVLIYSSSIPAAEGPAAAYTSGMLVHFIAYLAYAAILAATFARLQPTRRATIASLAVAALVGAVTELIQLNVPGRFADPLDWLVNVAGAVVGLVLICLLKSKSK